MLPSRFATPGHPTFNSLPTCHQEEMINLQGLREEATHDGEEIPVLRYRIRQVDERDEGEVAEEIGDSEAWTPEARELWQECVCLKNKNNRIHFDFSSFLPIPPHPPSHLFYKFKF